jgi:hypothetical protein
MPPVVGSDAGATIWLEAEPNRPGGWNWSAAQSCCEVLGLVTARQHQQLRVPALGCGARPLSWCAMWSVGTEGSERDRRLAALARHPLAPGRVGLFADGMRPQTGPPWPPAALGDWAGPFADGIRPSTGPPPMWQTRIGGRPRYETPPNCREIATVSRVGPYPPSRTGRRHAGGATATGRRRSVTSPSARRPFGARTNRTLNHAPTLSPNAPDHPSAVAMSRSADQPTPPRATPVSRRPTPT